MNWNKFRNNIPNKVRVTSRKFFDILWVNGMQNTVGDKLHGKTEFDPNKIILNTEQSDKEAVLTSFHELIHALDDSHEIGLTEIQVQKLEKTFVFVREFIMKLEKK